MKGLLFLEDGTLLKGDGIGAAATRVGELVFNTSMVGYQEILTDPSYCGQIINFAYPLIGNYGISPFAYESPKVHAFGVIARNVSRAPSHYTCEEDMAGWLKRMGVPGVCGLDTRAITTRIRKSGTMKCLISTEGITPGEAEELCRKEPLRSNFMKTSGTTKLLHIEGNGPRVAVLDFGIKRSIIDKLTAIGCDIYVFPYASKAGEILSIKPQGIVLSNGPGNPEEAVEAIEEVRKLIEGEQLPTFGICMGHQILALAMGGQTYKLKFGHRGGNHGVYEKETGKSYITSQNHGYAVRPESVLFKGMEITHLNLNDGSVEGMKHRSLPIFSVQYHPEASPGPTDSCYLFDHFLDLMKGGATHA